MREPLLSKLSIKLINVLFYLPAETSQNKLVLSLFNGVLVSERGPPWVWWEGYILVYTHPPPSRVHHPTTPSCYTCHRWSTAVGRGAALRRVVVKLNISDEPLTVSSRTFSVSSLTITERSIMSGMLRMWHTLGYSPMVNTLAHRDAHSCSP